MSSLNDLFFFKIIILIFNMDEDKIHKRETYSALCYLKKMLENTDIKRY